MILMTEMFLWFEDRIKTVWKIDKVPPMDYDYGVTWNTIKVAFKYQYIPESAISVICREWHVLKFSHQHVLKFNQRALKLITILEGSLNIMRESTLWEEYL